MSDQKPPSRNCAGCNEPNPPHETAAGYCLRCLHKEWIACQNDLQLAVNSAMDAKAELERVKAEFSFANEWRAQWRRNAESLAEMVDKATKDNQQLTKANAELATKATEAAEQLQAMTNAEDDARRELVRVRLRLDWLEATQPTPPTPEPSRNTAGLHEPVWDSRNSDEPKTEVL